MTRCESGNHVQVCHRQHEQRIPGLLSGSGMQAKPTLPDHWFEGVSLHHQYCGFYWTGYSRFNREYIWRLHQEDVCVWSIVLYQDFFKVIPKAKLPCVWVPPIPKSSLWESARIPFMQTLLTQCPCAHRSPDPNVIVNVYISMMGLGLRRYGCYQEYGLTFCSPREPVECHA